MKYLFSWLKEYYQTEKSPEEVAADITHLGTEIESIGGVQIDDKVTVAKILEVKPHPNADRLQIARITTGEGELEVVCGAPNIEAGQLVPYASVGAKMADFEVKEVEIRGVKSPGMLLSERELGISDEHEGIKILENVEVGEKVSAYLNSDPVLEAEVTPNRGDVLSHFGLSRDLAAQEKSIEKPVLDLKESGGKASDFVLVEIKTEKCPLYLARVIKGVKIGPSPADLKAKLEAVGAKSINNIVDATNFVMLDLGHPLHAFDAGKIQDKKIIISEIEQETEVVSLDGAPRALLPEMMVICDAKRPVAIAGIMGLKNSEVDDETTDIILEAAVFDAKSTRKSVKELSLQTEASYRFERGVDTAGTEYAINKAAQMIQELAGGEILEGVVQAGEVEKPHEVKIEYERINDLAGVEYGKEEVDKTLTNLGFKVKNGLAEVPSWRHDIFAWEDLVEEVIRMSGLERLKPVAISKSNKPEPTDYFKKEKIKDYLKEFGLDEVSNYSFLSDEDVIAAKIDPKDLIEVANPVQEENRYLRNSLVPGLLKDITKNPSFDDIEIFEIGNVFLKEKEETNLAIVTSGKSARKVGEILKSFCEKFSVPESVFKVYDIDREELKRFKIKKPNVSVAEVRLSSVDSTAIPESGKAAILHRKPTGTDLEGDEPSRLSGAGVSLGEILPKLKFENLDLKVKDCAIQYREVSKFPPVKRDLSFIVDEKTTLNDVKKEILSATKFAFLVEAFDEFQDKRFGEGKKNVAFHVWLQDLQKTMSDETADEQISKIIDSLQKKFQAELRS